MRETTANLETDPAAEAVIPQPPLMSMGNAKTANRSSIRSLHARGINRNIAERLVTLTLLVDAVVVVLAMVGSFWLRFNTGIKEYGIPATLRLQDYAPYISLGSILFLFALNYFGVYERHFLLRGRQVALKIECAAAIWLVALGLSTFILRFTPPVSRIYVLIAGLTTMISLLAWRFAFHHSLRLSKHADRLRQRVVIVGWNRAAEEFTNSLQADQHSSYSLVGYVNSAWNRGTQSGPDSLAMLGQLQDLEEVLQRNRPDMVLLSDVDCVKGEIVGIANLCEKLLIQFKIVPSYFQILVSGLRMETVHGTPVLGVTQLPLDKFFNLFAKRLVDIVGGTIGLICSAPLMLLFGLLVYKESPGPIFYRQRRVGRNGVHFDIYKIRSMRLNAEANGKVGWSTKNDPRRLRIGSFMRRWNMDELPQFWNVLKGDMSLVGPRPERPQLIANFQEEIPHYNARHNVKAGITGWAQVNGLRGDTDLTERIKCDLWYMENWNLLLDVQIMILTFLKREHAC